MNATTGLNVIQSGNTTSQANFIQATGVFGGNMIQTTGGGTNQLNTTTGQNLLTATTGTNKITTANTTPTANLIEATGTGGGNKLSTTTGQNLLTSTTGTNKLTTGNTSATANLIEATGTGGGNQLQVSSGGQNLLIATSTGTNKLTSASSSATANLIETTNIFGGNRIIANFGSNQITAYSFNTLNTSVGSGINRLQINSVTKLETTATTTTITNTDINMTGIVNITGSINLNTKPLVSLSLGVNSYSFPATQAANTTTEAAGAWLETGVASIRTPYWGTFIPVYCVLIFTGSFTLSGGGTNPEFRIILRDSSGFPTNFTNTQYFSFTPTTTTAPDATYLSFSSSSGIDGGRLLTVLYGLKTAAVGSISSNTKIAKCYIYGYQG